MPIIRMKQAQEKLPYYAPDRRRTDEVLGLPPSSASSWGSTTWKRMRLCPREHALYQIGLRPKRQKTALDIGLLYHHALEHYYKRMRELQQAAIARGVAPGADDCHGAIRGDCERAAWDSLRPFEQEPGYQETYAKLEKLLITYFEAYRYTHRWLVLAVEETLSYDDGALRYTARLDLIVHDLDGDDLRIVEHKTSGVITDDLLLSYEMDLQILGQVWLLHNCVDLSALPRWGGVVVDIITTRNKEPRVHRQFVSPSKYHTAAFEQSMREWLQVSELYQKLDWPKAFGACAGALRFFRTCNYYDLCHGHPNHSMREWLGEIQLRGVPYGFELAGAPSASTDSEEGEE